jgi:hypothetical protein
MKRITVLAASAVLVATPAIGARAAFGASDDNPSRDASIVRADDPVGHDRHHRHHGEAEPGDDHGRHHRHHGEAEPGDDRGGRHGEAEPGDDHGRHHRHHGEAEPGDDHGRGRHSGRH